MMNLRNHYRDSTGSTSLGMIAGSDGTEISTMVVDLESVGRYSQNMACTILPYGNGVGDPVMRIFAETVAGAIIAAGDGNLDVADEERREFLSSVGRVVVCSAPGFSSYAADGRSLMSGRRTKVGLDSTQRMSVTKGDISHVGSEYGSAIVNACDDVKNILLAGKCGGGEIAIEAARYLSISDGMGVNVEAVNVIEPLKPAWQKKYGMLGTIKALGDEFKNIPSEVMRTEDEELILAYGYDLERGQTLRNELTGALRYGLGLSRSGLTNLALMRGLPRYEIPSNDLGFMLDVIVASRSLVSSAESAPHRREIGGGYSRFEDPNLSAIAHLLGAGATG